MNPTLLQIDSLDMFVVFTLAFLVILLLLMTMSRQEAKPRIVKPDIKTALICTSCGTKTIREFREGDYISKEADSEKCPRCGGPLVIDAIYTEQLPTKP